MKLFSLICTSALLTAVFAADPATTASNGSNPMKTIAEKAAAARTEALAIESLLKSKRPDMAAAAARAEVLDKHVTELHEAAQTANLEQVKASAEVLKVITENKAKQLASADPKDRDRFRATAKNIAMRAEQIWKTSQKIGG